MTLTIFKFYQSRLAYHAMLLNLLVSSPSFFYFILFMVFLEGGVLIQLSILAVKRLLSNVNSYFTYNCLVASGFDQLIQYNNK